MSLFDLDDDVTSSSVASSEADADRCMTATASERSADIYGPDVDAHKLPFRSCRNMLTAEQARIAQMRRRHGPVKGGYDDHGKVLTALSSKPCCETPSAASSVLSAGARSTSTFGSSIAAALQLRRREKEEILLRRLRKRRVEEAADSTLVEKDLEVGVFVTTAYKQLLAKHIAPTGCGEKLGCERQNLSEGDVDDEDEPLDAYIRKLEATCVSPSVVKAECSRLSPDSSLLEVHKVTPVAQEVEDDAGSKTVKRQAAMPVSGSQFVVAKSETGKMAGDAPCDEVTVSERELHDDHVRVLHDAREAARGRRADAAVISGAAARCTERMLRYIRPV